MEYIKFLIKVLLTLAILAGCLTLVEPAALIGALATTDMRYLVATFVITVVGSIIVPAVLTRNALVDERISLSLGRLVMINFSLRFYMLVLPRPVSIGMRWMRYRQGGSGVDALALMVFERLVQLLVYSFTAVILLGYTVSSLPQFGWYVWFASIAVFLLAVAGLVPFFSAFASRLLGRIVNGSRGFMPAFLNRILARLTDAVEAFQGLDLRRILTVIGCSLASYILLIAGSWVLMQTMDFSISLQNLAWIRSVVFILTQIPVTVGGIGLREAGFISLLHMYGVAEHDALAYSLLFLFIHILIGLIGITHDGIRYLLSKTHACA
jgi:uncharacterized membrane protein YbhN (UPF0104 family)